MINAMRQWMGITGVVVGMGAWAAPPAGDPTGLYQKEGGTLAILQGDNETLVHYQSAFPQGDSAGTCECAMVVKSKTATRWTLEGPELAPGKMSLDVSAGRFVLEGTPVLGCCGAGWPGRDEFSRASAAALPSCKVLAPRVYFQATDEANTQRKAYVVKGDTVQAVVIPTEPDLVPGRLKAAKTTAGLLKREQLQCTPSPAPTVPASSAAVKPEQLQPLAGGWVELTKKGKGYVRFKPCAADTRTFNLHADTARMELNLGQESTTVRVTKLRPGTGAGAYVLELTPDEGARDEVQWKVVDADQGIVSLTSKNHFAESHTYVRDAKKSAFREESEKNCASESGE